MLYVNNKSPQYMWYPAEFFAQSAAEKEKWMRIRGIRIFGFTFGKLSANHPSFYSKMAASNNAQRGHLLMKGRFNKPNKKTVWYENYAPVKEYVDRALARKAAHHAKNSQSTRRSWLEIIKKSFPIE